MNCESSATWSWQPNFHTAAANAVLAYIKQLMQSPGQYNLYANNCAITVEGALKTAKLVAPRDTLPKSLFDWLKKNYSTGTSK